MIIAVTGYPASGKNTVSQMLDEEFRDARELETSSVTRRCFEEVHGREHRNSDELGEWITEKMESDNLYFARAMAEEIEEMEEENIILGGIRRKEELDEIANICNHEVYIIHVNADFERRYSRIIEIGRDGEEDFSKEDLREKDEREEGWGVDDMIESSDYSIDNNGNLQNLEDEVESLIVEFCTFP